MKFYSTNKESKDVSFKEAVLKGIADDGGLFMPGRILPLEENFFKDISKLSFQEIAFRITAALLGEEIPKREIEKIIAASFTFDAPLVPLNEDRLVLELFHGPTLAFKDFGARFMANVMAYLNNDEKKEITILVATSGDTGSAVANGFYKVDGIKVVLLYPGGKVSRIQEQQLTTLGENITALEILGTFDDCQRLVKQAFLDKELTSRMILSSANSINIARLLPQSFYYFNAYARLSDKGRQTVISVPSGNFGNLTAGLIAKKMGLPVSKFIAATNSNDVFPHYLETSLFRPKPSVKTLSNAMDVGNPSNFARILDLYGNSYNKIKEDIYSRSFSDDDTISAIREIHSLYNYIIDPHGAVGYLALKKFAEEYNLKSFNGIILETAHPAKFAETVESALSIKLDFPEALKQCLDKEKRSIKISREYDDFKEFLINKN